MTLVGKRIGPYELLERFEGSSAGEVYLARGRGEKAVLSLVELSPDDAKRVRKEIARCRPLNAPALVAVKALVGMGKRQALVFPAMTGRTLTSLQEELASQQDALAAIAVWHIGRELAHALAVAHRVSGPVPLVHGHVAPEQVVLTFEGGVRLVGFGASAAFETMLRGDPDGFAAPEVRAGKPIGREGNVYSVAAILWWLATGEPPPIHGRPKPLTEMRPDFPDEVARAIDRALAEDPKKRTTTAQKLADTLARHAEGGASELRWNLEINRALDILEEDNFIVESMLFAPSSRHSPVSSRPKAVGASLVPKSIAPGGDGDIDVPRAPRLPTKKTAGIEIEMPAEPLPPARGTKVFGKAPPKAPPRISSLDLDEKKPAKKAKPPGKRVRMATQLGVGLGGVTGKKVAGGPKGPPPRHTQLGVPPARATTGSEPRAPAGLRPRKGTKIGGLQAAREAGLKDAAAESSDDAAEDSAIEEVSVLEVTPAPRTPAPRTPAPRTPTPPTLAPPTLAPCRSRRAPTPRRRARPPRAPRRSPNRPASPSPRRLASPSRRRPGSPSLLPTARTPR